jgi:pimeloyl-ACP methyl ester carboxylesterase
MKKILLRAAACIALLLLTAGTAFYLRPIGCMNRLNYLRETLAGVQSSSVTVNGHRMHYLVEGPANGPAVVLVHGLGGSAEDWRALAPHLAKAGFRVYSPELFGYGRSEKPADFSYSVRDEAAAVSGFLDAMNLKQIDLGGWSMGGWVVQLVASQHPERIRRLILFDSAGLYAPPTWNTQLFVPTSAGELQQLQALLMPNPPHAPGFVVRDILRVSSQRGWIIHRALNSMLTGQNTTDNLLPAFHMPVLIVWGTADRIFPVAQAERMHQLAPRSELVLAEGCGHLAPRQCVGAIEPGIEAFLKR